MTDGSDGARRPRVAVLDYEAGNVRSAQRGLQRAGADAFVTTDPREADSADALCVPGVGNFGTCLRAMQSAGLRPLLASWIESARPILGICVGMQLLYEHSDEGDVDGLGLLPGRVVRLPEGAIVPHMGWDVVRATEAYASDPLLDGVDGERCYFVHAYYARPDASDHVLATTPYAGVDIPCLVREGSVVGTQFHPEKSGDVGGRLLANWVAGLG